jgi:hypothetical protein
MRFLLSPSSMQFLLNHKSMRFLLPPYSFSDWNILGASSAEKKPAVSDLSSCISDL